MNDGGESLSEEKYVSDVVKWSEVFSSLTFDSNWKSFSSGKLRPVQSILFGHPTKVQ